jgi:hypothetical protein
MESRGWKEVSMETNLPGSGQGGYCVVTQSWKDIMKERTVLETWGNLEKIP